MSLSASQVVAIAEIVRPGESVDITVLHDVAMVQVFSPSGELAMLELMGPRQDPPHLHLTDFGVDRPARPGEVKVDG